MKRMSFVPAIREVPPPGAGSVPGLEAVVALWTEGSYSAGEWLRLLESRWGSAGLAVWRGEEVAGFAVFAPREYLPYAERFFLDHEPDRGDVVLAYVGGDRRTRKHLLVRLLRDLRHRGVPGVKAVSSDAGASGHVPTRFLLENGWHPLRTVWYRGRKYTIARTDLGSTVEVGELARDILGRVKLPQLKSASPAPEAFTGTEASLRKAVLRF